MKTLPALATVLVIGCTAEPPDSTTTTPVPAPVDTPPASSSPPAVTVANTFRHVLHSDTIGQDFLIDVALPYTLPDEPMPVVYVTDGNTMFALVTNTTRLLQLGAELPPMIVVGIGHAVSTTAEVLALRTRDLTPTVDAAYVEGASQGPMALPEGIAPGGAAAFLDFIEDEVKPLIAANYPAKADDATLVGDSLGGLFALYALFNRTDDYQRYVAGSPSLWWDEKTLFSDEAAYADRAVDLDVDLFLSVGGLEEDPTNSEDTFKMVGNMQAMAGLLADRGYPNLRMTSHVFEDETHLSVIPATFSRGLREVFSGATAPASDE